MIEIIQHKHYFRCMTAKNNRFSGEKLRALRLEKGLTQIELGERAGLSGRMVVHYEKHVTKPPADRLAALARALGVPVGELITPSKESLRMVAPRFARKLEKAKLLPTEDQAVVANLIDSLLEKNGLKQQRRKRKSREP